MSERILNFISEIASDGGYEYDDGTNMTIDAKLFMREWNDRAERERELVDVLEAFECAVDLWLPAQCKPEETGEVKALHALRERMLAVLAKHKSPNRG